MIAWFQVSSGTLGQITLLSTVNRTNFDLYLKEDKLPPNGMAVACRVTIQHNSTEQGQYCGPRIAIAGMYIPVTVQLQGSPFNYPIYWSSFGRLLLHGQNVHDMFFELLHNQG